MRALLAMRLGPCFVVVLAACGGKLVPTGDSLTNTDDGSSVVVPPPPTPTDCSPAMQSNTELGTIDVTRLGCSCSGDDTCSGGALCVTFAGLDMPRCAQVKDACELVTCAHDGECVDYGAIDHAPWCYP